MRREEEIVEKTAGLRPKQLHFFCFSFFHFCGLMAAAAAMLRKREENERKTKGMKVKLVCGRGASGS